LKTYSMTVKGLIMTALMLGGCMAQTSSFVSSNPLQSYDPGVSLRPGITTRQDVIKALGPPLTLARQGGKIIVYPDEVIPRGGTETSSDVYFEIFRDRYELRDDYIIYYYQSVVGSTGTMVVVAAGSTDIKAYVSKLWVLIDDRTGKVIDYEFRPAAKR